ncbi:unnamed protein product [Effrenium voratum]|uniref:Ubiquitin-like domain-containing protein n=1 Tax=Effrenium voratum TaxID=2562239 RepID=A0AA36NFD4_9DINO|nr:unnamed protein product [Effrenium voratum]CAJ1405007.1 unnamed protein product [Effrenium voratum]
MLSKPSTTTSSVKKGNREHYATRYKREIEEEKNRNRLMVEFLQMKGMMTEFHQRTAVETSPFPSATTSSAGQQDEQQNDDNEQQGSDDNSNGEDGGNDDPDDSDSGDFFDTKEDFVIYLQLNAIGIHMTKPFHVNPSWQLKVLKCLLFNNFKVKPSWVRFTSFSGRDLHDHLTFTTNGVKDKDVLLLQVCGRGGGKRGQSGAVKRSKEAELKELKEKIASKLLRLSGTTCLSPSIANAKNEVVGIAKLLEEDPKRIVSLILDKMDATKMKRLSKEVLVCSTRATERTRKSSEIVFKECFDSLDELDHQRTTVIALLHEMMHYCFVVQFGDNASNISWSDFCECLTDFLTSEDADEDVGVASLGFGNLRMSS